MIKNYLLTTMRSLLKSKGASAINVFGLSVGMAFFILIVLFVYHELSYDRFHVNADRIYKITEDLKTENEVLFQATSSPPMGPTMQQDFPEVEKFVRFNEWNALVVRGDKAFYESECLLSDSTVFDVFSWNLLKGDPKTALVDPYSVVISEDMATRYFGDEDPVGQALTIGNDEYKVTGVVENAPTNSHISYNCFLSFSTWSTEHKEAETRSWFWNGFYTYLLLRDKDDIGAVRSKMGDFISRHMEKGGMYYEDLPLVALADIYLSKQRTWENGKRGSLNNIYVLSVIAVFIILIACFNYINLSTARASRRTKEVGLRKVLGAQRRSLLAQFIGESTLISVLSTLLGMGIAWLLLPAFQELAGTSFSFGIIPPVYFYSGLAALALLLGLLSGAYPALIISRFHPLQIFRPSALGLFSHQYFRKVLVTTQFVISIVLVAGTWIVYDQLDHLRNMDLGFVKEATMILRTNGDAAIREHRESIKHELAKIPGVLSVAQSQSVPGRGSVNNLYTEIEMEDGKMSPTNINSNGVDHDFIPAFGIQMLAGRNFSRENAADDTAAFIINETAMKDFGWTPEQALGKKVNQQGKRGTIIGVTKDFHYLSLHHQVAPLLITVTKYLGPFSVRIKSDNMQATVAQLDEAWKNTRAAGALHLHFPRRGLQPALPGRRPTGQACTCVHGPGYCNRLPRLARAHFVFRGPPCEGNRYSQSARCFGAQRGNVDFKGVHLSHFILLHYSRAAGVLPCRKLAREFHRSHQHQPG
ncbi:MAG: FtsX-like permease family protein [Bacteroidia bacterium]|nr:FtsX-like permease family protein [Bacteroidia bacterium]